LPSVETLPPSPPLGDASDEEPLQPEIKIASAALDVAHTPATN
jgi:hypothetical protein